MPDIFRPRSPTDTERGTGLIILYRSEGYLYDHDFRNERNMAVLGTAWETALFSFQKMKRKPGIRLPLREFRRG